MKAILIDPIKREVIQVEMDQKDTLQSMYKLIECTTVAQPVNFPNGDDLWIDDEGWFQDYPDGRAGFIMEGWAYAIVGRGLITGHDNDGNTIEPTELDPLYWRDLIIWRNHDEMTLQGTQMGLI
jgi:hypothetical protein